MYKLLLKYFDKELFEKEVYVQGGTIKYLVNFLRIKKKVDEEESIGEEIHGQLIEQVTDCLWC